MIFFEQALLLDIKPILLPGMNELLNKGLKVQSVKAWEWFIRLLGPYAIKNRHVVNDMLKILEQTFSDYNPQVQLASQVLPVCPSIVNIILVLVSYFKSKLKIPAISSGFSEDYVGRVNLFIK